MGRRRFAAERRPALFVKWSRRTADRDRCEHGETTPMSDSPSDADLVRRARNGDPAAWRQLVRRHTPMIHRLALRTLRNPSDAEDATQEVFVKMSRYLDTWDSTRPLPPWLGKMTYHVCLRRLGKVADAKNDLTAPDTLDLATSSDLTPEAAIAARQASDLVTRAVDQLPAQDRFLIDLRYREGQSDVEVAEATGMNVNTVRTRLFRARQALRKLLSPVLGAHPEENAR